MAVPKRKMSNPDSERYPFLKELISLDKKLHANWEAYDHYTGERQEAKGKRLALSKKRLPKAT